VRFPKRKKKSILSNELLDSLVTHARASKRNSVALLFEGLKGLSGLIALAVSIITAVYLQRQLDLATAAFDLEVQREDRRQQELNQREVIERSNRLRAYTLMDENWDMLARFSVGTELDANRDQLNDHLVTVGGPQIELEFVNLSEEPVLYKFQVQLTGSFIYDTSEVSASPDFRARSPGTSIYLTQNWDEFRLGYQSSVVPPYGSKKIAFTVHSFLPESGRKFTGAEEENWIRVYDHGILIFAVQYRRRDSWVMDLGEDKTDIYTVVFHATNKDFFNYPTISSKQLSELRN